MFNKETLKSDLKQTLTGFLSIALVLGFLLFADAAYSTEVAVKGAITTSTVCTTTIIDSRQEKGGNNPLLELKRSTEELGNSVDNLGKAIDRLKGDDI